jgi:Tfp pilus assembly protein PilF
MAHRPLPSPFALLLALAPLVAPACKTDEGGVTDDQRIALHREFARKYFDAGEFAQAENQVNLGLEIDSDDQGLLLMKAWMRLRAGTRDDLFVAEKLFREQARSKDYRALLGLAETRERQGVLYREAAENVESGQTATRATDPKKRAAELRRDADAAWKEARTNYLAVLETRPSEVPALNGLQRVCALEGDLEASLGWSRKLLDVAKVEIDFWKSDLQRPNLSALEEGELRRRLQASSRLLAETHLTAATTLLALDRKAAAADELTAALELDPSRAEAYSRRAQLLLDLGRVREARDDLQQFIKLSTLGLEHPDMKRAADMLVECQRQLGNAGS